LPNETKQQLYDLKALIGDDDCVEDFNTLIPRLNTYFNSKDQFTVLLDQKVPVNYNFLMDIAESDLSLFVKVVEILNLSTRSMLWQDAALYLL
jgi:hypothetical protein